MNKTDELAEQHGKLQATSTQTVYLLGDKLAQREGYSNLSGLNAVYYYLIQKHNWLPSQVKAMNIEDLSFCLEEEKL